MFRYDTNRMAQALSIVADGGIHGIQYNGLLGRFENSDQRQSKRFRFSPIPSHSFSGSEFEDYMILAWRFKFITRSRFKEYIHAQGLEKSSYALDDEEISLTQDGWEFIEKHYPPLLHRWGENLRENVPSIVTSIVVAVLASWAVSSFGAPK